MLRETSFMDNLNNESQGRIRRPIGRRKILAMIQKKKGKMKHAVLLLLPSYYHSFK